MILFASLENLQQVKSEYPYLANLTRKIAIEETEIAIMVGTIAAETVVAGSITAGMNAVEMSITRKVAAETIVAELIG